MQNRPSDIPYCGVDLDKIKNAKPTLNEQVLEFHHLYITERTEIYKKKDVLKAPQPWTTDEVFLNYRFTNTRRELDRESNWLTENISNNAEYSLEEKVLWSIFFRTYNKSSTFEILGLPSALSILDIDEDNTEPFRDVITDYTKKNPKYVWFTPAFNCGGLKASWAMPAIKGMYECTSSAVPVKVETDKGIEEMTWRQGKDLLKIHPEFIIQGVERNMPMRMFHLIKYVAGTDIVQRIITADTQEDVFNILMEVDGLARFLAYQIFVDLTYIPEFKFSENEFVVAGPGAQRGLHLIFDDMDGMSCAEALFWLRDNLEKEWDKRNMHVDMNKLFDFLPEEDRCLNVMLLQNSHCELQKLVKSKLGTGRPRNKYVPTDITPIEKW